MFCAARKNLPRDLRQGMARRDPRLRGAATDLGDHVLTRSKRRSRPALHAQVLDRPGRRSSPGGRVCRPVRVPDTPTAPRGDLELRLCVCGELNHLDRRFDIGCPDQDAHWVFFVGLVHNHQQHDIDRSAIRKTTVGGTELDLGPA